MPKVSTAPVPMVPPALEAELVIEDDRWSATPEVEAAVNAAIAALCATRPRGLPAASTATIVLACDSVVAALNARFRGKQTATNVLSFPAGPGATAPGAAPYLGDVIIAHETVAREAADSGITLVHHVQHLTIHGVLHLLGYDHSLDRDAAVMEALETRILALLGVADPYQHSATPRGIDAAQIPLAPPHRRP